MRNYSDLLDFPQKLNEELKLADVLVHGDLWISNLMFKTDADQKPTDQVLKILDWQVKV